jgi:membrane fusion protein, multidrug efflux system
MNKKGAAGAWGGPIQHEKIMQFAKVLPTLAALFAAQALAQGGPPGGSKIMVETVRATTTTLESALNAVGTLLADASAELRAEVPGQILSIHFEEGQHVDKGAKLFSIEAAVLEAEVNEARANAERSRAAYERARQLDARDLISAADYDAARANHNVDTARLRSSEARLVKTVIRAPFAGFSGLRRINIGDYATVGQSLVDIVGLDPLRVDFNVPETVLASLAVGQAIEVSVAAYPDRTFGGAVVAIAPQADVAGHSIQVRASLPNPDLLLRPGLFAEVEIALDSRPDAIVIPEQAIWPVGRDKTVFVVVDGKAVQTVVELGERRPGLVEVLSGIDAGDEVVTAGQMKLFDGAAVESVAGAATAAGL